MQSYLLHVASIIPLQSQTFRVTELEVLRHFASEYMTFARHANPFSLFNDDSKAATLSTYRDATTGTRPSLVSRKVWAHLVFVDRRRAR